MFFNKKAKKKQSLVKHFSIWFRNSSAGVRHEWLDDSKKRSWVLAYFNGSLDCMIQSYGLEDDRTELILTTLGSLYGIDMFSGEVWKFNDEEMIQFLTRCADQTKPEFERLSVEETAFLLAGGKNCLKWLKESDDKYCAYLPVKIYEYIEEEKF